MTKLIKLSLKMINSLYFFFCTILLTIHTHVNYILYEVTAYNAHERALLYFLHVKKPTIIFINGVSNEAAIPMDVIVRKDTKTMFENKLNSLDIQYIYISSFSIEPTLSGKKLSSYNISDAFYDWESILSWTDAYPGKPNMFKKTVIAKTFERRDIFILKVSKGKKKPIIFIVGGEDGMDWMSSSLILNLFNELLDSTSNINTLTNKFDFYLLPILNPDGFVYSKKKDRLWSKNRREIYPQRECEHEKIAVGVNIARNWFFQKSSKTADIECNSVNIGHKPLSEEENQALSYVLNNLALDMIAFINVKGFGRYITVPYGHPNARSNNHDIIMEILRSTNSRILEKHNVTYYLGTTANYFYNFSGNMVDWVKLKLNTPIVYTVYLEDENTVLPLPGQIKPLKEHFFTILNESLLISQDIYGPLFNNEVNLFFFFIKEIMCFFYVVIVFFYI